MARNYNGVRATRSLLDELMGRNRNQPAHKRTPISWKDDHICKNHICGWCPIRDFHASKADIGNCVRKHNEIAKHQFQKLSWKKQKKTYETYLETLELVKRELDFRTRRSNDKLLEMLTASENGAKHISVKDCPKGQKEADKCDDKVSELLKKIEKDPQNSGKYVSQLKIFQEMSEDLRAQKEKVYVQNPSYYAICEDCGALNAQTQEVMTDHNVGQVHTAFSRFQVEYKRILELFKTKQGQENKPSRSRSAHKDSSKKRKRSRSHTSRSSRSRSSSSSSSGRF